ncbi:PepSY-associated TM helix domain-containing protein, partial [Dyella sp.]|uniref:PepSY-associated TM helix domain-containing protein n=1 Tax=Dyella sp. TaxID=1869338 RepID=UPI002ED3A7E8
MTAAASQPVRSPRRVRQLFKILHLWLGLGLGLLLALVTLSGCVLTFERPLLTALHPILATQPLPDMATMGHTLDAILASPEGDRLRGITLPNEYVHAFEGTSRTGRVYFDPGSGLVILRRQAGHDPLLVLLDWHTHLLTGEIGETVLGIVACAGLFMLVSGVWLYWPGRKRALTHLRPHPRPPILR